MILANKLAKAYDEATLALAEKRENRKHLGASVIGDKCSRKIWYKFRWAFDGQQHEPRLLRLFRRGHREEPEFIRFLSHIPGVQVWHAGDDGEHKESLRISDVEGHFGGTPDGVIRGVPDDPDEPMLLEFKTMNDSQYHQTKKDGVMTAHWEYFVQMQCYMEKLGLRKALFGAVNKDDDQVHWEIVSCNGQIAEEAIERARGIIYAEAPPPKISESAGFWLCKFCDFQKICHFDDIPAINCRTCAFAAPGPAGSWTCAQGNAEVEGQLGCERHIYNPQFFAEKENFEVLGWDEDLMWIEVFDGVSKEMWGPRHLSSPKLLAHGFIPF